MKVDFVKFNIKERRTVANAKGTLFSEYLKVCEECGKDCWVRKSNTRFCGRQCCNVYMRLIRDPQEHYFREKLTRLRSNAVSRNKSFSVTWEDLQAQYIKQEGKCFYTDIEMLLAYSTKTHIVCPPEQLSVDRIDPNKGYEPDNIVLCCYCINNFKGDSDLETFKKFCLAIAKKVGSNES